MFQIKIFRAVSTNKLEKLVNECEELLGDE